MLIRVKKDKSGRGLAIYGPRDAMVVCRNSNDLFEGIGGWEDGNAGEVRGTTTLRLEFKADSVILVNEEKDATICELEIELWNAINDEMGTAFHKQLAVSTEAPAPKERRTPTVEIFDAELVDGEYAPAMPPNDGYENLENDDARHMLMRIAVENFGGLEENGETSNYFADKAMSFMRLGRRYSRHNRKRRRRDRERGQRTH